MDKILRASKAGFPCNRNLWYSVNGFEPITSPHSQRIFDVGNCLEPLVVQWLIDDGWSVVYNQGSQHSELEVTVPLKNGILAGHPDCFISKGELQNCLVDIKTMNDRAFTLWKRDGSVKSKPQYVIQLHIYALGCLNIGRDFEKLGIVALNKNNSDWNIDFFDFDKDLAENIKLNAEFVFSLNEPPSENCPAENWCCNYCEFSHLCELHMKSSRDTSVGNNTAVTHDFDVINAMQSLKRSRTLLKEAKALENEAKSVLDEKVRQQGLRSVQADNLLLNISERSSSRFDSAAFKNAYPDIASKFTNLSTSLFFDLKEVL